MLIYLEDSNGYTEFKDTKERIESKRNRDINIQFTNRTSNNLIRQTYL